MYLIDEEHTGHDFSTAFFTPFRNFLVDLFAHFWFNFSDVSCKKSHEALSAGVYDIDFVEGHGVDNFLSLLELTFGALHEACLGSDIVVVAAASE